MDQILVIFFFTHLTDVNNKAASVMRGKIELPDANKLLGLISHLEKLIDTIDELKPLLLKRWFFQ